MTKPYVLIPDLMTAVPEIPADSIISRTLYTDPHANVVLFAFAAGQELSEHTSAFAASLQFLQGDADLTLGGDHIAARAGTWVRMAPKLPHTVVARTPVLMLLQMDKSPRPAAANPDRASVDAAAMDPSTGRAVKTGESDL